MEGSVQARGVEVGVERGNVCVDRLHGRPAVSHHLAGAGCFMQAAVDDIAVVTT